MKYIANNFLSALANNFWNKLFNNLIQINC